jgi:hypothetical protein
MREGYDLNLFLPHSGQAGGKRLIEPKERLEIRHFRKPLRTSEKVTICGGRSEAKLQISGLEVRSEVFSATRFAEKDATKT